MAHPIYKYKGKRISSVTTILSKYKDPGGLIHWAWNEGVEGRDYRKTRDAAADAGTVAHTMIEAWIEKQDPELAAIGITDDKEQVGLARKGFDAFLDWHQAMRVEFSGTEVSLVGAVDGIAFGGTFDAVGSIAGKPTLFDWKSGNGIYPETVRQVAAYKWLWENGEPLDPDAKIPDRTPIEGVVVLRVGKQFGDFHVHSYPEEVVRMGWDSFRKLLDVFNIDKDLKKVAA